MTTTIAPTRFTPVSNGFETAYRRLVDARVEYEMLRSAGAPTGAIADARSALHRARAEMAIIRRGLGTTI